jgi:hypothetical protein
METTMRKLFTFLIALAANVFAVCSPASAQLGGGLMFPGPGSFQSSGGGYTGPADAISANLLGCWSLRACSSATRGNKVANVCVSGTCADMLSSASTGDLVSQTINGTVCPSSGTGCLIKTVYFQTGSLACTPNCDLTQATVANQPYLTTVCGSLTKTFCVQFTYNGGIKGDDADGIVILAREQVADQRRTVSTILVSPAPTPPDPAKVIEHEINILIRPVVRD